MLRKNFFHLIMANRLDQVILKAFHERNPEPPFSDEQLKPFKQLVDEFLMGEGIQPDWSVPVVPPHFAAVMPLYARSRCIPFSILD